MYRKITTIALTFLVLQPCAAQQIDVLAGKWKGNISVISAGISYTAEVNFENSSGQSYEGEFHCKLQQKDRMAAKNWNLEQPAYHKMAVDFILKEEIGD